MKPNLENKKLLLSVIKEKNPKKKKIKETHLTIRRSTNGIT
jgi:hypothetical protein